MINEHSFGKKKQTHYFVYRIFYDDIVVYVGRTKQPLQDRIRAHLFSKPMHRTIDIRQVSKIEYAEFRTEANMNLYEIYFILKFHPYFNVDDKTKDALTVTLPEPEWQLFSTSLWEKWKKKIQEENTSYDIYMKRYRVIPEEIRILRSQYRCGSLTEKEYDDRYETLEKEYEALKKKLFG